MNNQCRVAPPHGLRDQCGTTGRRGTFPQGAGCQMTLLGAQAVLRLWVPQHSFRTSLEDWGDMHHVAHEATLEAETSIQSRTNPWSRWTVIAGRRRIRDDRRTGRGYADSSELTESRDYAR